MLRPPLEMVVVGGGEPGIEALGREIDDLVRGAGIRLQSGDETSDTRMGCRIEDRDGRSRSGCARDRAKADVFDDIERFHDPTRGHSTLKYLTSMDFERRAQSAEPHVHQDGGRPDEDAVGPLLLLSHL